MRGGSRYIVMSNIPRKEVKESPRYLTRNRYLRYVRCQIFFLSEVWLVKAKISGHQWLGPGNAQRGRTGRAPGAFHATRAARVPRTGGAKRFDIRHRLVMKYMNYCGSLWIVMVVD